MELYDADAMCSRQGVYRYLEGIEHRLDTAPTIRLREASMGHAAGKVEYEDNFQIEVFRSIDEEGGLGVVDLLKFQSFLFERPFCIGGIGCLTTRPDYRPAQPQGI